LNDLILGVEIGGTKLQLALGQADGEILGVLQGTVNPQDGAAGIQDWLLGKIPSFLNKAKNYKSRVMKIGCGFGGPINSGQGEVLKSVQIRGWSGFPLKDWFESNFNIESIISNDSNAAAWGEYQKGSGKGSQNFFYTNMGSGVGGGLIINGGLHDGRGYGAGEFGQTYVPDWTSELAGQPEKIENLCSGWAIEKRLRKPNYVPRSSLLYDMCEGNIQQLNSKDLAEAAKEKDQFALKEIDQVAFSMGLGLANVLCLTSPEVIAIGGGVSQIGNLLLDPIRKYTAKYEFITSANRYEIVPCVLKESIVLVGAILLAYNQTQDHDTL